MENKPTPLAHLPEIQFPPEIEKKGVPWKKFLPVFITILLLSGAALFFLFQQPPRTSVSTESDQPAALISPTTMTDVNIDTSDWLTYQDTTVGFSFKYPGELIINEDANDEQQTLLRVEVQKVSDIPEDLPLLMGRKYVLAEKDRLAKGEGDAIVQLGSINGLLTTDLSQFEVCSTFFARKLSFYPGEYQTKITLSGPKAQIIADMPNFFHLDSANCGTALVWDRNKIGEFESVLANHQGNGSGQKWYDTFTAIVNTVQVIPMSTPQPTATIVSGTKYTNQAYGFELSYHQPYRLLTDKDSLYGYPHGIALLYTGGQAYNIVIEVWDTQAEYEAEYGPRLSDVTVLQNKGKFVTFLNNDNTPETQKIIDSAQIVAK